MSAFKKIHGFNKGSMYMEEIKFICQHYGKYVVESKCTKIAKSNVSIFENTWFKLNIQCKRFNYMSASVKKFKRYQRICQKSR